jgi:hypothetical protein
VSLPQDILQFRWDLLEGHGRQHDHGAGTADSVQSVGRQDLESAVGYHRPRGDAAHEGAVPGNAERRRPLVAEDVAGDTELERRDPVVNDDGDGMSVTPRLDGPA